MTRATALALLALAARADAVATRAKVPSVARAVKAQKLTVGVEISHADLPPPPSRGLGVSIHHQNLYDESEDALRVLPIREMSAKLRESKASVIAISGMGDLMEHVSAEQADARGQFPGPAPVLYIPSLTEGSAGVDVEAVARAGASAVLLAGNSPLAPTWSDDDLAAALSGLDAQAAAAKDAGIESVVELLVDTSEGGWDEARAAAALEGTFEQTGCDVLLINPKGSDVIPVPKSLKGRVVCSVRVPWTNVNSACDRVAEAGYCGALLRCECMPMSAESVVDWGDFWSGVITSARSNRSKNITMMVAKAKQKDAMRDYFAKVKSSGQFDEMGSGASLGGDDAIDTERGDYVGFG